MAVRLGDVSADSSTKCKSIWVLNPYRSYTCRRARGTGMKILPPVELADPKARKAFDGKMEGNLARARSLASISSCLDLLALIRMTL